jgi:GAF domain-containing protein
VTELSTSRELIIGLLKMGATPNIEALFDLIVQEAPRLVGARECSIFWKNGAWRERWRQKAPGSPDDFYRRATYEEKRNLIGTECYQPGDGLTGWVIKHGKTLRIDKITDDQELKQIAADLNWKDKSHGFHASTDKDRQQAFLAVPVSIENEVVGVIRIAKTTEAFGRFTSQDQELLETFAKHVGAIIGRAEAARLKDLWENLYLSGITQHNFDFNQYLQRIADEVPRYLGAEACSIFTTAPGEPFLLLRATTMGGPLTAHIGKLLYEFGEGLTGWVAKHCKTLCLRDVNNENELKNYGNDLVYKGKYEEYVRGRGSSSYLAAPVHRGGQLLGVIRVAQDSQGGFFSSGDQRSLEYFCQQLAVLLQNFLLFERVQREKDDTIQRLQDNRQQLRYLGERLREDLAKIGSSLEGVLPKEELGEYVRFGPIVIERKRRDDKNVFVGFPYSSSYENVYDYAVRPALEELKLAPLVSFGSTVINGDYKKGI